MKQHIRHVRILEGTLTSLAATGLLAAAAWLFSEDLIWPAVVLLLVAILAGVLLYRVWRRRLRVIPYLELADLKKRIAEASNVIWSFQISGGEFTRYLVQNYERWLAADPRRRLKIMFVDPENEGLLESLVKLSGKDKASDPETGFISLRQTIRKSLQDYSDLRERMPDQVDLRVYDCCPPCSIHAVDVEKESEGDASMFIENYLPDLPWRDRPCFLLNRHSAAFDLYRSRCGVWFADAREWEPSETVDVQSV
jgi:hypothetical protein